MTPLVLLLPLVAAALAAEPKPAMYDLIGVGWRVAAPAGFKPTLSSHGQAEWERKSSRELRLGGKTRRVHYLERIRARLRRGKSQPGGQYHTCGGDEVGRTVAGRMGGRVTYAYQCLRSESGYTSAPYQYFDLITRDSGNQADVLQLIYEHHWRGEALDFKDMPRWRLPDGERLPSMGMFRRMQRSLAPGRVVQDPGGDSDSAEPEVDTGEGVNLDTGKKAPLLR